MSSINSLPPISLRWPTSTEYIYAFGLIMVLAYFHHIFIVHRKPSEPPLEKGWIPYLGVTIPFLLGQESYITALRAKHGEIFTLYMVGYHITVVLDPISGIPAVYRNSKTFSFHEWEKHAEIAIMGLDRSIADNKAMMTDLWATLAPYLSQPNRVMDITRSFVRHLSEIYERELPGWIEKGVCGEGMVVDLKHWWYRWMFEAAGKALFGDTFPTEKEFFDDYETFEEKFGEMMMMFPSFLIRKNLNARKRFRQRMSEFFGQGLVNESEFVRARINVYKKYGYTEADAGRGMLDMLLALEANPLPASMWYMLHVLASPSREPILSTISQHATDPSNPCASSFNLESLLTDPLLHALFSETLRLQATTLTVRGVMSDTTLPVIDDEYFIRQGTILIAPASALHMDSEIFPDPKHFKSDRFYGHGDIESVHIPATGEGEYSSTIKRDDPDNSEIKDKRVPDIPGALIGRKDNRFKKNGIVVKHNLIPFGGGDHLCPGRRFAEYEIVIGSAAVLRPFEIEAVQGGLFETAKKGVRFGLGIDSPGDTLMARIKLRKEFYPKV